MTRKAMTLLGVAVVMMVLSLATTAPCQMFNAYLPQNAPAAAPPTPYYLRDIPRISRTYYPPCPTCGPAWAYFPDVPPISRPVIARFGIPVPVP